MTIATVTVCDAIRANVSHLPKGQAAGYSCRASWRPSAPAGADLGTRNPHASARSAGQAADLRLRDSRITFPQVR
jgi:hypothetical protein